MRGRERKKRQTNKGVNKTRVTMRTKFRVMDEKDTERWLEWIQTKQRHIFKETRTPPARTVGSPHLQISGEKTKKQKTKNDRKHHRDALRATEMENRENMRQRIEKVKRNRNKGLQEKQVQRQRL